MAITTAPTGLDLIHPDDPRYDEARHVFNGDIDKRPALIARCRSAEDVRDALAHARENDLEVAVRGGGHSMPGFSTCDGGIVIDVGPMKDIEIDLSQRVGRFGAGLTWGEFDAATQTHGLAVTGGRVTHTGIAGLTLGSGSGWLERKYGMTAEHLISAELVTADGQVKRASAAENPELFWGLKGGGGNFGVVTEFEFRLHPLGRELFAGKIVHPRSAAPELIRFYRDFMEGAPDEVGGGVALMTAPDRAPVCGLILVYAGDPRRGPEVFRPLLDWGDPIASQVGPTPYTSVQAFSDEGLPWGISLYPKIDYMPELTDEAIDVVVARADEMTSPHTQIQLTPQGGALDRIDRGSMAMETPRAKWCHFGLAAWWGRTGRDDHVAWARRFGESMRPYGADTAPPNFISGDEGSQRLRRFYGEEKFERLVALKDVYDPENVFALNQNIPPSGS